jgi:hypothetical protein
MVVRSLAIEIVELSNGVYKASAPWLDQPVQGTTADEAFKKALYATDRRKVA